VRVDQQGVDRGLVRVPGAHEAASTTGNELVELPALGMQGVVSVLRNWATTPFASGACKTWTPLTCNMPA
jgi:hypothetical protein